MNLAVLLQATTTAIADVAAQPQIEGESYLSLIMKGGWIMVPILFLSVLSIYIIIERWIAIRKLGKTDSVWLSRVVEFVHEGKREKALKFTFEQDTAVSNVVSEGLKGAEVSLEEAESSMEMEARVQISRLEKLMNYLSITASIAPMLGFLGTIFGVIKIFYNISATNDLAISSIADGLYQKMICSGAGLLVGIIAYSGYYVLNGMIDKAVLSMDKGANDLLKALRSKKGETSSEIRELL